METLLKVLGGIVLFFALIFLRLFILTKIWALAIVPNFPGAPLIGLWQVFALSWFIGAMTYDHKEKSEDEMKTKKVVNRTLSTILSLLASWGLAALIF